MLWLQRPPYLRWAAAAALVALALWSEFAPPTAATLTFLAVDVAAGTPLTEDLVERRQVPTPGFATAEPTGVAVIDLAAGEPLVASMISETVIPDGWLLISAPMPGHAAPGLRATGVILPSGEDGAPITFPALVVDVGAGDAFADDSGTLAVPPEWLGPAATAAGSGRLVVGVESPTR